jgi:hypothetical protein
MTLKTRKPTGKVPPPVILLEGEEGSGKSWITAELSTSPKVGRMLWIELGRESTADQYGAIPDTSYEMVEPDAPTAEWDWHTLFMALRDARDEAARAREAGEPPTVLVVDQVGAIWDMLSEWADNRARSTETNSKALAANPNAEYVVGANFWNDATDRWKQFMTLILKFKGIVILLSRGQEVTLFENSKPTKKKTWKVDGQKQLTFDVPVWIRLTRDGNPSLIKMRSVTNGIRPGIDRARGLPSFTLEKLIFELIGWDPTDSGAREVVPMVAGNEPPPTEMFKVLDLAVESAEGLGELKSAFDRIKPAVDSEKITGVEGNRLTAFVGRRKAEMEPVAPPVATGPAQTTNGSTPALVGAAK